MFLKQLEVERNKAAEELVAYPLGALCFMIDRFKENMGVEEALQEIQRYRLTMTSIEAVVENMPLLLLVKEKKDEFRDLKDVIMVACFLIFNPSYLNHIKLH